MRRSKADNPNADDAARQRTRDRRAHSRAGQDVHAVLTDARGHAIGRGKTGNISEGGVYMVVPAVRGDLAAGKKVRVELAIPTGRGRRRNVRYTATIVRTSPMGTWTGVAIRFDGKLR